MGTFSDSHQWRENFFEKSSGNIPDGQLFLKKFGKKLNAFQNFGNIPGGQLFLEKFEKSENGFNFFGNIPGVNENFSKKAVLIFGFLAIYPKKA